MTNPRPRLFDDEENLDLSEFQPQKPPRQEQSVTSEAAEKAGFRSREPKNSPPATPPAPMRGPRRRTGRNAQLNLKAKPETIGSFYAIADAQGWGLGETLEKAVDLLEKTYKR